MTYYAQPHSYLLKPLNTLRHTTLLNSYGIARFCLISSTALNELIRFTKVTPNNWRQINLEENIYNFRVSIVPGDIVPLVARTSARAVMANLVSHIYTHTPHPQCTILWQKCAHMCTFLLRNDALRGSLARVLHWRVTTEYNRWQEITYVALRNIFLYNICLTSEKQVHQPVSNPSWGTNKSLMKRRRQIHVYAMSVGINSNLLSYNV